MPRRSGRRFGGSARCARRSPLASRSTRWTALLTALGTALIGALNATPGSAGQPAPVPVVSTTAPVQVVGTPAPVPAASTPSSTSVPDDSAAAALPSPLEYVQTALDFVSAYGYYAQRAEFRAARDAALEAARHAPTVADTYPIITKALKALGDHHSTFQRPPDAARASQGRYSGFGFTAVWPQRTVVAVAPGSPAEAAGLRVRDRIDRVNGKVPTGAAGVLTVPKDRNGEFPAQITLTVTRPGVRGTARIVISRGEVTLVSVPKASILVTPDLGDRLAYLDVPGIIGDGDTQATYATQLQQAIRSADAPARCGWIVDLRRNRGGYIYAMLAGLGPLAGDGDLGGQLAADGKRTSWNYAAGVLRAGDAATVTARDPYAVLHPAPPVAVLTSSLTASAGEAVAIAFAGLTRTRRFGEATLGLTTFNVQRTMPDGAYIVVTNAVDTDRTGRAYDGPLAPDDTVSIDWAHVADDRDPVIAAAGRWLRTQPSCAA